MVAKNSSLSKQNWAEIQENSANFGAPSGGVKSL
jgi:hypothetical protein